MDPSVARPSPLRRWAGLALGLVLIAGTVAFVAHVGELKDLGELLKTAQWGWLIAAVGLQALTYLCVARLLATALAFAGYRVSLGALFALCVAKQFADRAVPSGGLSGHAFLIHSIVRRGVPVEHAAAASFVEALSFHISLVIMFAGAFAAIGASAGVGNGQVPAAAIVMGIAILAAMAGFGGARLLRRPPNWLRRHRRFHDALLRTVASTGAALGDGGLMLTGVVLQMTVVLLDIATLWVAAGALGRDIDPVVVAAGYISAKMAAAYVPVPLGLGTYEATGAGTLMLLGVAPETALAAIVIHRALTTWLPMVPGAWLMRREIVEGRQTIAAS